MQFVWISCTKEALRRQETPPSKHTQRTYLSSNCIIYRRWCSMTSACRAWWLKRWPRWRHTKHVCRMRSPLARKHRRWRRRRQWAWKTNANVQLNLCIASCVKRWGEVRRLAGDWDGKSLVKGIGLCRSPSLGARNYPIFLTRRFRSPNHFYFEFQKFRSQQEPQWPITITSMA